MVTVKGVEIARVQTVYASGSDGEPFEITREILASVVEAHSRLSNHVVSIAKGHWFSDSDPALGRLENIRVDATGDRLLADFTDVPEDVADEIRAGKYPNRSIGLIGGAEIAGEQIPWHLDHLALLGAAQPAVAGMTPLFELFSSSVEHGEPVLALSRGNSNRRESLGTHRNPKGTAMDPKAIREALGLPEDVSDDDVLAKLCELNAAKSDDTTDDGDGDGSGDSAENVESAEEVAVMAAKHREEVVNLQRQVADLKAKEDDRERADAVRAAVDEGKLVEAEREQWLTFGKDHGTKSLKVALSLLGRALPNGERGTTSTSVSGATDEAVLDDYLPSMEQREVYLSMHGHEMPIEVQKQRAYDKAINDGLTLNFSRPKAES